MMFGYGGFPILGAIFAGLLFIVVAIIVVGLLVLIVRFLLIVTKAAETYIRVHEPLKVEDVAAAPVTVNTVPAEPDPAPTVTQPAVKPPAAKRTPKVPPTV